MPSVSELHPPVEAEPEKVEEPVIDIEAKEEIEYDDFMKMQFQVGEIIACEAVKKSKKLLCSQVKIGSQVKQIVSGIKAHYTPEEMVGKKVMVLVNLKPAKLAGVLSEGMILCAEDEDGNLVETTIGGYLDIGLNDTMKDLLVNFLGAIIFNLIAYLYIKNNQKWQFVEGFIPTKTN